MIYIQYIHIYIYIYIYIYILYVSRVYLLVFTRTLTRAVGSDGKPIRLLRCGHSFDATCIDKYLATGRNSSKCPICRADIATSSDEEIKADRLARFRQAFATSSDEDNSSDASSDDGRLRHRSNNASLCTPTHYEGYYAPELRFRLQSLSRMHPTYVTQRHINLFSRQDVTRLVSDPSFTRNPPPPSYGSTTQGGGSSHNFESSGSFGGGHSSGAGGGGRW